MRLSELLVLLSYEVQRSYDFVESSAKTKEKKDISILHIALEKVEIELPVSIEESEVTFDPNEFKKLPVSVKMLHVPYTSKTAVNRHFLPKKPLKGKAVSTKILGPLDKIDDRVTTENIGRMKIVLKPYMK